MEKVFLLSPANSGGERAKLLFNPSAGFDLARKLQRGESVPIGIIFSFLSGLYFRGKYAYVQKFGHPPKGLHPGYVITTNSGLLPVAHPVTLDDLKSFGTVAIDARDARYAEPLLKDARKMAQAYKLTTFILLGSIGTKKYAEPLIDVFGERLQFPTAFVGRGDMSRGGLLLRAVAEEKELDYAPLAGSIRHGTRPAKLAPRIWGYKISEGEIPTQQIEKAPRLKKRRANSVENN